MVDLTRRNVERQLIAMAVDQFEIGILTPGDAQNDGRMALRTWTVDQVLKSLGWLKGQNGAGCHIFVRPLGSQGLIFIDDLTVTGLQKLEADAIRPACVVESSPMNYQAWVRVSNTPIDEGLASAVGKIFAKRYGGDPNSTDWRHFGRLVGFTNRKPQYVRDDGSYPFVLLRESTTTAAERVATAAIQKVLGEARALVVQERLEERLRIETLREARANGPVIDQLPDPAVFYRSELHGLMKRYGKTLDLSKADWTIGRRMAAKGYIAEQIMIAFLQASPSLASRKSGHVEDYITRTVKKLLAGSNED